MATFEKDFRIKQGIVVEGSTATVNGNNVLTTASSLDSLGDVVITSATNGQVLKYNGTNWINDTDATGGGGGGAINDLTDVTITSISDNEILQYDSGTSQWINQTIAEAGLVLGVGTNKISYQTTAPSTPSTGDIWIDSDAVTVGVDAISETIIDAKGDLIVGTAADTVSRLGVGVTNGHVLTIDSGESTGLKWAATQLGITSPGWTSGEYYGFQNNGTTNGTYSADITLYYRFYIPATSTFDRIACRTGTNFSGTAEVRLGIYNHDSSTDKPSTVLLDAGTVSCTAASTIYEITIDQTLNEGWYWFAFNSQTTATTNAFSTLTNPVLYAPLSLVRYGSNFQSQARWQETGVTGAFDTAGSLTSNTQAVAVVLRKA